MEKRSSWRKILSAEKPWSANEFFSVPLFVRFAQLYAFGHSLPTCAAILNEEFEDIEVNPITQRDLETILDKNRDMLKEAKMEMMEICKEVRNEHLKEIVQAAYMSEARGARQLAKKLDDIVTVIIGIDITLVDEQTGKPINLSAYLTALEAFEKTQKLLGKLAGTDAMRELEVYRAKAQIDAEHDPKNKDKLLSANGKEIVRPSITG